MVRLKVSMVILALTAALALNIGTVAQKASPPASPAVEASVGAAMETEIAWLPEWTIKPGHAESARAVVKEMMTSAQGEPGTLSYAVYVSEDGQTFTFYERYADEAAVLAHQAVFNQRFAARAMDAMTCTRITVLGSVGEEIRQSIGGCNPVYLQPVGGFSVR